MYQASYYKYLLDFKFEAGTSRGVLRKKETYFVKIWEAGKPNEPGWGEAAPLIKLSIDHRPDFGQHLAHYCQALSDISRSEEIYQLPRIAEFPSILTAFEMAFADLENGSERLLFSRDFHAGQQRIPINGLIWMGDRSFMKQQIAEKLAHGYTCIKMKIGAIDFEQECGLLAYIRQQFAASEITLRVDANGAFNPAEALEKLKRLSEYDLHSIEQPIRQGQWEAMAELCQATPLPIALDEELIGNFSPEKRLQMLEDIQPHYIILKPSLMGGFRRAKEWIGLAEERGIGWWLTSALEANIGLNAIAQFAAQYNPQMPQGLGTGQLYTNNILSPLTIDKGEIYYSPNKQWGNIDK